MKRHFTFLVLAVSLLAAQLSCTDYGEKIAHLQQQVERLEKECGSLSGNAAALSRLVEALEKGETLSAFEPIAEDGTVTGFRLVFEGSGEVTVYNRASGIGVGEEDGRYYWMNGDEWLRDAAGGRVEVGARGALPQFRAAEGRLEVSLDGGKSYTAIGNVDKCLVTSVQEDAARVVFTLWNGAVVAIPKYQALTISLSGDNRKIGAGETVEVAYSIEGAENAGIKVLCGTGWSAAVTAATTTTGTIAVTAPSPIAQDEVIVFVSDGNGRMTSVRMTLVADESTNPLPPVDTVLRPFKTAYEVPGSGGEILADVFANVDYSVETSAPWLHYMGTKAVRTDRLAFYADANEGEERSATATLTSGNYSTSISFLQAEVRRYLNVSETRLNFDEFGGTSVITVSANVDYDISVPAGWMELSGQKQQGVSRFILTISGNDSFDARSGEIRFTSEAAGTRTVTVSQAGTVPMLEISPGSLSFSGDGGSSTLTVLSNVPYTVSQPTQSWLTVSGTPAAGRQYFSITAGANADYTARTASVTFSAQGVPSQTLTVNQAGRKAVIPRAGPGANLYTAPSGAHYRYGPSIILNDDGSIDVWTSKEGANFLYYGEYAYQETGSRSKESAYGHTLAQYFSIQHKFASIQLRLYGTDSAGDAITIKLYQWKGSYSATVASAPIATRSFSNIASGGNRYRVYQSNQAMMPAGEYLWTATAATNGVGIYKYSGAGTISITDAVSYYDGSATDSYNFEMRPRGRATGNFFSVDRFAYFHSTNGGGSWTPERDVLFGTEGCEDEWSVCDPGVARFGGWYYIGYTSAPGKYDGTFNHCYLARSRTPRGPWYKWNGSSWGGEPAKVVEFTGSTGHWGLGEPSIVVKDDIIYLYHSYVIGDNRETRVLTAPVCEDWPARLTSRGTAFDQSVLSGSDSADVKYVEDYGLFYAFHTYNRMTSASKIAVWVSTDGLRFIYQGDMTGSFQPGMHNMGVSGDGQGHIRLSQQQYVAYAFHGNGNWGNWSTRFAPLYFD